jgi:hypothetical protein
MEIHMKKLSIFLILLVTCQAACTYNSYLRFFKQRISIADVIKEKEKHDATDNPALRYMILSNLSDKLVVIDNILVRDVVKSNHIDYEFCIMANIPSPKGTVECYIYARNIYEKEDFKTLSRLEKGKTRIDVTGSFNRFITLLDDSYTKVELTDSSVSIRN